MYVCMFEHKMQATAVRGAADSPHSAADSPHSAADSPHNVADSPHCATRQMQLRETSQ